MGNMVQTPKRISSSSETFAEASRRLRGAAEMTLLDLARKLGIDRSYICRWETAPPGVVVPSEKVLKKLALIFGTHPHFWIYKAGRIPKEHQDLLTALAIKYGTVLPEALKGLL